MKPFSVEQRDWLLSLLDFNALRFNLHHHLGLGDIRLTIAMQDQIEKCIIGNTVAEEKICQS